MFRTAGIPTTGDLKAATDFYRKADAWFTKITDPIKIEINVDGSGGLSGKNSFGDISRSGAGR